MKTRMLTPRFGRAKTDMTKEVAPAAAPVAEQAVAPDPKPESKPEAVAAPPEAVDATAQSPARLVEGERPKPRRAIDLATLRDRLAASAPAARKAAMPAAAAASLILAMGIGYGLGTTSRAGEGEAASASRWLEATSDLRATNQEVTRLAQELKAVRVSVDGMKSERDKGRGQLAEKLDRSIQESGARFGKIAEQLDRFDRTLRDPARLASVMEKLDRLGGAAPSGAGSAAPTPPPKPVASAVPTSPPVDVTQTGSIPDAKPTTEQKKAEPDPRKAQVEGYFVRDYDEGFALIETKNGRYVEVAVGYTVPGIGRVETIERRGRQWVVTTPKGFIGER